MKIDWERVGSVGFAVAMVGILSVIAGLLKISNDIQVRNMQEQAAFYSWMMN